MAEYNDQHLIDINRVGKITASLAAAIMGIDPYITRQEAWRRIMGRAKERPPNPHQQAGMKGENTALEEFQVRTGMITSPGRFIIHPDIPWLGASPDGLTQFGYPVEAKTMTEDRKKYLDTIAPYYYVQCQVQIQCCKKDKGWFIQYGGGHPTLLLPVEEDKKYFWETIYQACHEFYFEYVLKDVEPPRKKRNA